MRNLSVRNLSFIMLGILFLLISGCSDKKSSFNPGPGFENHGDINHNRIPNEIADAVMFVNYFINGTSAFGNHAEASIAESDVNDDGRVLRVADLVYLIRRIVGDANPISKPHPESPIVLDNMGSGVTYDSPIDLGGAFLIFHIDGEIGNPMLGDGASKMDLQYARVDDYLRVLIYNIGEEMIPAGENTLVSITGDFQLAYAEITCYEGCELGVEIREYTIEHSLSPNYPNPFSASTTICLALAIAADWNITIKDIDGKFIKEFSGYSEAGMLEIVWDGTDDQGDPVDDGVYFYKATVGDWTATKSMMLLR